MKLLKTKSICFLFLFSVSSASFGQKNIIIASAGQAPEEVPKNEIKKIEPKKEEILPKEQQKSVTNEKEDNEDISNKNNQNIDTDLLTQPNEDTALPVDLEIDEKNDSFANAIIESKSISTEEEVLEMNLKKPTEALEALKILLGDLEKLQSSSKAKIDGAYKVEPGETLDMIIEKTTNYPIRKGIMRQAFVELNSHAFLGGNPHRLLANVFLKIPTVNDIRFVIFPKGVPSEESSDTALEEENKTNISKKDKSKWVRYP